MGEGEGGGDLGLDRKLRRLKPLERDWQVQNILSTPPLNPPHPLPSREGNLPTFNEKEPEKSGVGVWGFSDFYRFISIVAQIL